MKDGVIVINKPSGWTSQDVCAKLRNMLHIRKAGHTGTLDPMATGVLPVCTGKATRIIEYYDQDMKTYHACMKLGITSDTLDIWGKDFEERKVMILPADEEASEQGAERPQERLTSDDTIIVTESSIRRAFAEYTGVISQVPPKYSALKINGKRAYDLARQGEDFEIRSREITIASNEITDIDILSCEIGFEVVCSKGTYIRTICDDIGRTLGCGAVMTSLVRTGSGHFRIGDAVELSALADMDPEAIDDLIIPMDITLDKLGICEINDNRVIAFINGNSSRAGYKVTEQSKFGRSSDGKAVYRVYNRGLFLGTAVITEGNLVPDKVIKQ